MRVTLRWPYVKRDLFSVRLFHSIPSFLSLSLCASVLSSPPRPPLYAIRAVLSLPFVLFRPTSVRRRFLSEVSAPMPNEHTIAPY
jgi:hypothetical protein